MCWYGKLKGSRLERRIVLHTKGRVREIAALALVGLLVAGATSASDETYSLEELYEIGASWLKEVTPSQIWEEYEILGFDEWRVFLMDFQSALNGDSYDTLAAWLPYARDALNSLRQFPAAEPYADWLAQRLDYFEVAEEAVRTLPPARPSTAPPPPAHPPLKPPPKPVIRPAPRPPVEVQRKRNEVARNETTWKQRLQSRPAPARAAELAPLLKGVFREEGMPEALIWIAEVESSFNPQARSPVGAAGLFQFMPATAERYGLALRPRDQRLDPQHSARAAARYLRALYGQFGDWPLAFAAYNAGEGRVGRLLKTRGARSFAAIENDLPVETRMYVPKVLATIEAREGLDARRLPAPFPRAMNLNVSELFARVE